MNITDQPTQASGSRPSRRTVVKGAAWAVPAIAVASAMPATAASCVPAPVIDTNNSCKQANQNNYKLAFKVGGKNCPDRPDCTVEITRVYEATGQAVQLWPSLTSTTEGGTIVICGSGNMSAKIMVTAIISCPGTVGTAKNYEVTMPSLPSTGGACTTNAFDFCAPFGLRAPVEQPSSLQQTAPVDGAPAVETAPAAKTAPAVETAPAAKTAPAVETAPAAKTAPAAEKTLTVESTPSATPTPAAAE